MTQDMLAEWREGGLYDRPWFQYTERQWWTTVKWMQEASVRPAIRRVVPRPNYGSSPSADALASIKELRNEPGDP